MRRLAFVLCLIIALPAWAQQPPEIQTLASDYQAMVTAQGHFQQSLKTVLDQYQKALADGASTEAQKATLMEWLKAAQDKK